MSRESPRHLNIRLSEDIVSGYIFAIIAAVVLIVLGGILWSWILYHDRAARYGGFERPEVLVHAPREIAGIYQTLILHDREGQRLRESQSQRLESWGWIDQRQGTVHIPIDEAIRLVVKEAEGE